MLSFLRSCFLYCLFALTTLNCNAQDTAKIRQLAHRAEADVMAGNTYGAIKLHLDIMDLDAGNYQSANALSGLYGHLHQAADQMTWARKAIEINPKYALAYISLGNAYGATGDMQNAEESYKKAEQLDPQSPLPPYCVGVIEESKGDPRTAIEYYKRSIERDSLFVSGYCSLAVSYAMLQDYPTAEKYIDQAIAIDPKSERALEIKSRIKDSMGSK